MIYKIRLFTAMLIALIGSFTLSLDTYAQVANNPATATFQKGEVFHKTFNFIEIIDKSDALKQQVRRDALLSRIVQQYTDRADKAIQDCKDGACFAAKLKWTEQEITEIAQALEKLYLNNRTFKAKLSKALQEEAYDLKYVEETDTTIIRKAWHDTALGLNHILDVYIGGKGARYPNIDSISYRTNDPEFVQTVRKGLESQVKEQGKEKLFYKIPLQAALKALEVNGRNETARYEPLEEGINSKPYQALKKTDWAKYNYSMILVLGHGPEDPKISLDAGGAHYCEVAAQMYKDGIAPFIVVSGGNVHPYKTPYNEAEEMKRYLVEKLGIPDEAVFIEPHARHTTTNLRNVSRMVYRFHVPDSKPILTVTNPNHSKYTLNIHGRCLKELDYLPFKEMKKVSEETNAFYPVYQSLRVNPYEPLDP